MEHDITLTVSGITRGYRGDIDALTSNNWNEIVAGLLDAATPDLEDNKF